MEEKLKKNDKAYTWMDGEKEIKCKGNLEKAGARDRMVVAFEIGRA